MRSCEVEIIPGTETFSFLKKARSFKINHSSTECFVVRFRNIPEENIFVSLRIKAEYFEPGTFGQNMSMSLGLQTHSERGNKIGEIQFSHGPRIYKGEISNTSYIFISFKRLMFGPIK